MRKSDSIQSLAGALFIFQNNMGKVAKSANNPFFKSKYAPLPEILEAIREPLFEAGLTFSQFPDGDSLTTILIHVETGEWMEASYNMHPVKSDPQSVGSAITYARRYALGAILGLNIDDDDDGNMASQPQTDNREWLNKATEAWDKVVSAIKGGYTVAQVEQKYKLSKAIKAELEAIKP
jgi:hypothetical protein